MRLALPAPMEQPIQPTPLPEPDQETTIVPGNATQTTTRMVLLAHHARLQLALLVSIEQCALLDLQ